MIANTHSTSKELNIPKESIFMLLKTWKLKNGSKQIFDPLPLELGLDISYLNGVEVDMIFGRSKRHSFA